MNINDFDPTTLEFGVIYEDHFAGRHPEDGSELLAQVYFVTATAPDGTRFKRYVGTYGWVTDCDPEDGFPLCYQEAFHNGQALRISREELADTAAAVATRLEKSEARRLNAAAWEYAGAVYGSEAYERNGCEAEQIAAEEREAEMWG